MGEFQGFGVQSYRDFKLVVIQWSFSGYSVVIQWSFNGYLVVIQLSFDGHSIVVWVLGLGTWNLEFGICVLILKY
jgi:hypothetical protein